MKPDEPTTIIDCPKPLEIRLHRKPPEEELPDAGDHHPPPNQCLGKTPSLGRTGVPVPTQSYYYAQPRGRGGGSGAGAGSDDRAAAAGSDLYQYGRRRL